jgi:hypothetical protein
MTGAANAAEQVRLANNIAPAPFGYEPLTTRYVIAETTLIYVSPLIYPGAISTKKLQPGQPVNALAKVKNYDWILVGQNGVGIGYIPISRLMPVNK